MFWNVFYFSPPLQWQWSEQWSPSFVSCSPLAHTHKWQAFVVHRTNMNLIKSFRPRKQTHLLRLTPSKQLLLNILLFLLFFLSSSILSILFCVFYSSHLFFWHLQIHSSLSSLIFFWYPLSSSLFPQLNLYSFISVSSFFKSRDGFSLCWIQCFILFYTLSLLILLIICSSFPYLISSFSLILLPLLSQTLFFLTKDNMLKLMGFTRRFSWLFNDIVMKKCPWMTCPLTQKQCFWGWGLRSSLRFPNADMLASGLKHTLSRNTFVVLHYERFYWTKAFFGQNNIFHITLGSYLVSSV